MRFNIDYLCVFGNFITHKNQFDGVWGLLRKLYASALCNSALIRQEALNNGSGIVCANKLSEHW